MTLEAIIRWEAELVTRNLKNCFDWEAIKRHLARGVTQSQTNHLIPCVAPPFLFSKNKNI